MDKWFLHGLWSFLGKKPPWCDVRFVGVNRGGDLQVSCILYDIFFFVLNDLGLYMMFAISFMCVVRPQVYWWVRLFGMSCICRIHVFDGTVFKSHVGWFVIGHGGRASKVFGGMCTVTLSSSAQDTVIVPSHHSRFTLATPRSSNGVPSSLTYTSFFLIFDTRQTIIECNACRGI